MRGYTCSSALSAIREILYHPVKYDVELVSEIKGVLREIEDAAEPSGRASAQGELAATVPPVGAANSQSVTALSEIVWDWLTENAVDVMVDECDVNILIQRLNAGVPALHT
jgi:hypothetical protein